MSPTKEVKARPVGRKLPGKPKGPPPKRTPEELSYKPVRGFKLDGMFGGQVKQPWDRSILLLPYEEFSAKGMNPLYRLDWMVEIPNSEFAQSLGYAKIHCRCTLSLGIWREKTGRLLVRLKSTRYYHDCLCYELTGWKNIPIQAKGEILDDSQVPWIVKAAYEEWATDCFLYPDD